MDRISVPGCSVHPIIFYIQWIWEVQNRASLSPQLFCFFVSLDSQERRFWKRNLINRWNNKLGLFSSHIFAQKGCKSSLFFYTFCISLWWLFLDLLYPYESNCTLSRSIFNTLTVRIGQIDRLSLQQILLFFIDTINVSVPYEINSLLCIRYCYYKLTSVAIPLTFLFACLYFSTQLLRSAALNYSCLLFCFNVPCFIVPKRHFFVRSVLFLL